MPIAGMPEQTVDESVPIGRVALLGSDYPGLKPELLVAEGDEVVGGQPVLRDRTIPGVQITAPVSGVVVTIHRGAGRRLQSLVIRREGDEQHRFRYWPRAELSALDRQVVRHNLLNSGLWAAFRARPFSRIPEPESVPAAIFVTATDTNPLAADPDVVIAPAIETFFDGIHALSNLTDGKVYICAGPGSPSLKQTTERIQAVVFCGPHPAGLVGTHIHHLEPVGSSKTVWHLNYQDVIAIGLLFTTGCLDLSRVVSLGGPQVRRPRLLRVPLGANLDELVDGELFDGPCRIVSGSVLSGRRATGPEAYLGRYHLQVSVLGERSDREFLGWLAPGRNKFSANRLFASSFTARRRFNLTTSQHGSPRAMVPIGSYEKVMPLDILITLLLKALLVNDTETAKALGCLEFAEEDLALCSFVCCSKYDFGEALSATLQSIAKTG